MADAAVVQVGAEVQVLRRPPIPGEAQGADSFWLQMLIADAEVGANVAAIGILATIKVADGAQALFRRRRTKGLAIQGFENMVFAGGKDHPQPGIDAAAIDRMAV